MSMLTKMFFLITLVAASVLISTEAEASPSSHQGLNFPYTEQEVVFQNKNAQVRLVGTLSLPFAKGSFPAVVFCSGFGPQHRYDDLSSQLLGALRRHLAQSGIAVLHVDDRGVGKSTGDFREATSADFATDALSAIAYLKSRKEIVSEQIGLLGHGEGGLVASIAAAHSHDVAFVVMMAGPGIKGDQIVVGAGGVDLEEGLIRNDLLTQIRLAQERIFDIIKQEGDCDGVSAKILKEAELFRGLASRIRAEAPESAKAHAESVAAAIENQGSFFVSRWFRFYFTYDPKMSLSKLSCPMLAIYGAKDVQVAAQSNVDAIRRALDSAGNRDYTTIVLPNLNHLFQPATTGAISEYTKIEDPVPAVALDAVSDWILEHTTQVLTKVR
jgi:uncharacterized protein